MFFDSPSYDEARAFAVDLATGEDMSNVVLYETCDHWRIIIQGGVDNLKIVEKGPVGKEVA